MKVSCTVLTWAAVLILAAGVTRSWLAACALVPVLAASSLAIRNPRSAR